MSSITKIAAICTAAQKYANAVADTVHYQQVLSGGYDAWREETGNFEHIAKGSLAWQAMMAATESEYRDLTNAKGRERRAKKALLKAVEG